MSAARFRTDVLKWAIYLRIILHIPVYYLRRPKHFRSPIDYARFLRRALQLLLVFRHNKIVRVCNGWKLHLYLPAYPSRAFFYAIESKLLRTPPGPSTIVFSMTKACPYRCRHCYQRNDAAAYLDEARMIETALAVRDTGVAMFDIEGGEPLARFPRLRNLVQALDERSEIWINTTGAGLDPGMLAELKKAGLFGLMVSIHSPDSHAHDDFTGVPGSFDTACAIIRECRALNLVAAFNSVLSEESIHRGGLEQLMDLARELDCDYVQLIHPKPAGVWLGRTEGMQTEQALIDAIRRAHVRYNSPAMRNYPALAAQVFEEKSDVLGCTAGAVDRYYVGASGEVQPCEFLNISFGNVNQEPFETIYSRMRSYFQKPGTDWLCCTQADAIRNLISLHGIVRTPVPWPLVRELVDRWDRGAPTPIYKRLGIYP